MSSAAMLRYSNHPAADHLPQMSSEGYIAFRDHMRSNGYDPRHPIVLYQGQILDGRHRYRAALELGLEPVFITVEDGANPWEVAITGELRRNYETEVQRVLCLQPLVDASAAWQEQQRQVQDAANAARSAAAKEQHAVSNPRAGETMDYGGTTKGGPTIPDEPATKPANRQRAEALAAVLGVGRRAVESAEWLKRNAEPAVTDAVKAGTTNPAEARRMTRHVVVKQRLDAVAAQEVVAPTGLFDVIVIDPPWAMEKIKRDLYPDQVAFDYPTMGEAELAGMTIPCADDCHVWVWTTHKFLPMAFRLLDAWGLKYVCTFVWHKPGGFQVVGLPQYNCEFALYARRGSPQFIDTKAFPVCFDAPRGAHSEKPEQFYDVVRRVTAGRRLDMFNRRPIDGFTTWGNEAAA